MILKNIKFSSNLFRFQKISLLLSYDNNVLYFLSTYENSFINVLGKKKKEFYSQLIKHDICI